MLLLRKRGRDTTAVSPANLPIHEIESHAIQDDESQQVTARRAKKSCLSDARLAAWSGVGGERASCDNTREI